MLDDLLHIPQTVSGTNNSRGNYSVVIRIYITNFCVRIEKKVKINQIIMNQNFYSWNFILNNALGQLQNFARDNDCQDQLEHIFGSSLPVDNLLSSWLQGRFSDLPQLKITPSNKINGANGAFTQSTNTLYLSEELVNSGDISRIVKVFLEEYGHYLNAKYNTVDPPGDKGEYVFAFRYFSRVVIMSGKLNERAIG